MKHLKLFPILLFLVSMKSYGALFSNSYVSFQLPPKWECTQEATEWICRSQDKVEARQAIIVLTAKEVGMNDNLNTYQSYLKTPKTTAGAAGKPVSSQVKDVRIRKIQNHDWVDGLHLGSEIPGYYTRYLATVKANIAVLVTFSAHQKFYARYSSDFMAAINSLQVKAVPANDPSIGRPSAGPSGIIGDPIGNIGTGDIIAEDEDYVESEDEPSGTKEKLFLLGIALLAVGGYFFLRQKRKKEQNPFK